MVALLQIPNGTRDLYHFFNPNLVRSDLVRLPTRGVTSARIIDRYLRA